MSSRNSFIQNMSDAVTSLNLKQHDFSLCSIRSCMDEQNDSVQPQYKMTQLLRGYFSKATLKSAFPSLFPSLLTQGFLYQLS